MADAGPAPVREGIPLVLRKGSVAEVRAISRRGIWSGYFDDPGRMAEQVAALDADPDVRGIYVTLNEVNPALLARRANRLAKCGPRDATTSDADILRRLWFPIDLDPVRPAGVSSTDEEHALAAARADEVVAFLAGIGFPAPVKGDSGNGAHLLYRIDLPNDPGSLKIVAQGLAVLDALFSDGTVTVDTANANAGRIWKLYGTVSRKGDSTGSRPHRRSHLLSVPEPVVPVTRDLLERLSRLVPDDRPADDPAESPGGPDRPGRIDPGTWLPDHGIPIRSEKPWNGGTLYVLDRCPFSSAHRDGAYVIRYGNGAIFAGCHHASCGAGKQRWRELRETYERPDERVNRLEQEMEARIAKRRKDRAARRSVRDGAPPGGPGSGNSPGHKPAGGLLAGKTAFPRTDAGNAERLVARFGERVRYCAAFEAWFIWNGKIWERDLAGKMLLLATEVARGIHGEAAAAGMPDEARALSRWAVISESLRARKAMIESAAPHVPVTPAEFDRSPLLLNCRNGTLDLATRRFRAFRKEDLLTRMAAAEYDPGATCPGWLAHLELIFGGDSGSISGFQEMCGYSLTGTNPQQVMFILYGKGRNGKSRTIEVLARILADYAVNLAAESLMIRRSEGARSDLARLAGCRMATAGEGEDGTRLAESIVKQLTGEYSITVRRLYENEFEFSPTAKIWLTTNHAPVIRGTDDGIWRRIWMVPFAVRIPEESCDPEIAEKLLAESSGILNWCLDGLARIRKNGNRLTRPEHVFIATNRLRMESDIVARFLEGECTLDPGARISRLDLKELFERWCREEGVRHPVSMNRFAAALRERGISDGGKSGSVRFWAGIRVKFEDERIRAERERDAQERLIV